MSKIRFVKPTTDVLNLSEGDWLRVKHNLSVGDARDLVGAGFRNAQMFGEDQGTIKVDWKAAAIARVLTYVVEWSFRDEQGRAIPVTPETVASLTVEAFNEIDEALDAHVEKVKAEKNAPTGSPEREATSS